MDLFVWIAVALVGGALVAVLVWLYRRRALRRRPLSGSDIARWRVTGSPRDRTGYRGSGGLPGGCGGGCGGGGE